MGDAGDPVSVLRFLEVSDPQASIFVPKIRTMLRCVYANEMCQRAQSRIQDSIIKNIINKYK